MLLIALHMGPPLRWRAAALTRGISCCAATSGVALATGRSAAAGAMLHWAFLGVGVHFGPLGVVGLIIASDVGLFLVSCTANRPGGRAPALAPRWLSRPPRWRMLL